MLLDRFTHKHPVFYQRKRAVINTIKKSIYRLICINGRVEEVTRAIHVEKRRIHTKYCHNKRVLDVGCGCGDFLQQISPSYAIGTDVSTEMLLYARKNHPDYLFIRASADALPFGDKSFDVVTFNGVFHHLPPLIMQSSLKEARRVARETILIEECVPFEGRFLRNISRCYWKIVDSGYRYPTLLEWKNILGADDIIECLTGQGIVRYAMFVVSL